MPTMETLSQPLLTVPTTATSAAPADIQPLRWGPIWAGLLTTASVFLLLTLLAVAAGLVAWPGVDEAAADDIGVVAIVLTSVIAAVSFFMGGFVSSWSASLADPGRSLLNGFLVWALWLVAVVVLTVAGLGSFAGDAGDFFGQVTVNIPDITGEGLVALLRDSAWQTLLVLLLTAGSAALGGIVGARDELRVAWARVITVRPRICIRGKGPGPPTAVPAPDQGRRCDSRRSGHSRAGGGRGAIIRSEPPEDRRPPWSLSSTPCSG